MNPSRIIGTGLAGVVLAWGAAHAGALQITAQGIAPGGGRIESAGGCRRLEATFGEPVAGRSSGGAYAIVAGFQAGLAAGARDSIFHNGFQECQ